MTDTQHTQPKWHLATLKIRDLKPHPSNPRVLTDTQGSNLQTCINKYGLIDKPTVNLDNMIIGGHQRIALLKKQGVKQIECWQPDRQLTQVEVTDLMLRLNKNTGGWDYDALANNFDIETLFDAGFSELDLSGTLSTDLETDSLSEDSETDLPDADAQDGLSTEIQVICPTKYKTTIEAKINKLLKAYQPASVEII